MWQRKMVKFDIFYAPRLSRSLENIIINIANRKLQLKSNTQEQACLSQMCDLLAAHDV